MKPSNKTFYNKFERLAIERSVSSIMLTGVANHKANNFKLSNFLINYQKFININYKQYCYDNVNKYKKHILVLGTIIGTSGALTRNIKAETHTNKHICDSICKTPCETKIQELIIWYKLAFPKLSHQDIMTLIFAQFPKNNSEKHYDRNTNNSYDKYYDEYHRTTGFCCQW